MNTIINLEYECCYNSYGPDYVIFEIKYHLKEVSEEFLCNNKIKFRLKSKEDEVVFTLDCRTLSIQENDAFYKWADNNIKRYYRDNLKTELKNCLIETVRRYMKYLSLETQCKEIHFIYCLAKTNLHFSSLKSLFYDYSRSFIILMDALKVKIVVAKGLGNRIEVGYNIFMTFAKIENNRHYKKNTLPSKPYTTKYTDLLIVKDHIQLSRLVQKHTILYQSNCVALVPNGNVALTDYIIQCTITDKESNVLFRFNYTPFLES